jgi:AcrR family transcriptional regulator
VRDAIVEATATLVARDGLRAVTMAQVAQQAGIGRATLYKYFPSVEAIRFGSSRTALTIIGLGFIVGFGILAS